MGKRQEIEARLDNLNQALRLLLEIAMEHKEELEHTSFRIDELSDHTYMAIGDDIDRLYDVVDPWGKRPGSAGYLYKHKDELLEWDDVKEALDLGVENSVSTEPEIRVQNDEITYSPGEAMAFIDGYDEGQKDCAPCEVADENSENLPELSFFDQLRLLLWD